MLASRGIDQVRDRVVAGRELGARAGRRRPGRPPCPGSIEPMTAPRPSACAPAERRGAQRGVRRHRLGVAAPPPWRAGPRCASPARRSSRLLLAAPSVPSATLTPRFSIAATGREAARQLEVGRGAVRDRAAVLGRAARSRRAQVHRMHRDQVRRHQSQPVQPLERAHAVLGERARDLVGRSRAGACAPAGRARAASVPILRKVASDTV